MTLVTRNASVRNIMTRHLYMLNPTDSVEKAKMMFEKYKIRHLPVIANHQVVGMLSYTDILRMTFGDDFFSTNEGLKPLFESLKVEDVMQTSPHTVNEEESIEDVATKLRDEKFHALPVVNDSGICGIITTTDVIDFFLEGSESNFNIEKNQER